MIQKGLMEISGGFGLQKTKPIQSQFLQSTCDLISLRLYTAHLVKGSLPMKGKPQWLFLYHDAIS